MRLERDYAAGADELLGAFVDPTRLAQWFQPAPGLQATIGDNTEGDTIELLFDSPEGEVCLQIVHRERDGDRSLAFDFQRRDQRGEQNSRVTVDLEPKRQRTQLVLTHEGLPADKLAEAEAGWHHALGRLIAACPKAMDTYYAQLTSAPGYRSPFGGFWPDRLDAEQLLAEKRAAGQISGGDAQRFEHWQEKGYVVLPRAVPEATIDALRAEIASDWERGNPRVEIELCESEGGVYPMQPELQHRPNKVIDYHTVSRNARNIEFAPAIRRFLEQLFERPPTAFQSLLFRYGTEQEMHQDTAYVVTRSPMQFVGCWVALEDVAAGSGELQYYEGSHRIPEYLWFDRGRCRPPGYEDHADYLAWVRQKSETAGCKKASFLAKKGDALLWHADLVHGGSPRVDHELTRWSLVTHFCPADVEPAWVTNRKRREHAPGAFYFPRKPKS